MINVTRVNPAALLHRLSLRPPSYGRTGPAADSDRSCTARVGDGERVGEICAHEAPTISGPNINASLTLQDVVTDESVSGLAARIL
jgi:hypothetical protein